MEEKSKSSAIYQITILAHPEHVLATLRDLPAYPDWQDDITTFEVLRFDDHGLPAEATMAFNSMGMKMTLTLALAHDDHTMRWSLVRGDFITRNDAEYTVTELGDGRTSLSLRQELSLKWRMPQSLIKHMIEQVVAATMEAVKKRAEETRPVRAR